jgi:carbonic anhydrase
MDWEEVAEIKDADGRIAEVVKRGTTMEEIARLREPVARTPAEAIRELKIGNSRFFSGTAERPEISALERRAQILAQTPFAVVLGCSDSRVPIEVVFDQGLGNLFVTRVAGNVVESATIGSIEYAVEHLKSHVVVVMGHEGCGAVKAAMLPQETRDKEPECVRFLLDRIAPAVNAIAAIRDEKARMREAVVANVRQQVHALRRNPTIQRAIERGQISLVGAYYEITSGAVDFFETEESLRFEE